MKILFSSHPQVSTGQGGQEAVAGLLQSLVGQQSQQHQGIANQGQQDQQTKDAACRKADVTSKQKSGLQKSRCNIITQE